VQQSAEDEVQSLTRRSSKIVSKACSLANRWCARILKWQF